MALSGSFTGTTANEYIIPTIVWSATQSISENCSYVTAELRYSRTNSYTTYGEWYGSITINGTKVASTEVDNDGWIYIEIKKDSNTLAMKTPTPIKVPHNSDGTKSITISAVGRVSGTTLESTNISDTITLNTIPRASSITSAGNVTLGGTCNVKWTPLSTNFAYKLKFVCGDVSYTTDYITPNTTSAYTYKGYTMAVSKWAAAMGSSYSATCKVTLSTYSSSSSTTVIGTSSATFSLILDSGDVAPTVALQVSGGEDLWNGYYIQGKSKAKITAQFKASEGSSLVSCSVSGHGISWSGSQSSLTTTTNVLTKSGDLTYTAIVKDGRSSAQVEDSIYVYPYSAPIFTTLTASMSSNGGAKITYKVSCSAVASLNSLETLKIYRKLSTASTWTLAKTLSLSSTSASGYTTLSGLDTASSYDFKAEVSDTCGSVRTALASTSSSFRILNIQKSEDGTTGGLAIGKMSEDYIFDCNLPARFLQNLEFGTNMQGILKTNYTNDENGDLRNIVYIQTGQDVDGGSTMGLALHNASVYVENSANSGKVNLGSGGRKWNQLYAANSTISTSDRTKKTNINNMSDVQEQLFNKLQPVTFEFVNGSSGRTHYGFISQDVEDALEELELTGQDFAGFCKDLKTDDDGNTVLDENGQKVYNYSLRYAEFIALNTYMIQKLQERIIELETEIKELKETTQN